MAYLHGALLGVQAAGGEFVLFKEFSGAFMRWEGQCGKPYLSAALFVSGPTSGRELLICGINGADTAQQRNTLVLTVHVIVGSYQKVGCWVFGTGPALVAMGQLEMMCLQEKVVGIVRQDSGRCRKDVTSFGVVQH